MLQDELASVQQELSHKMVVLREQATQLGLKHERYKTAARLNEEISTEVEALLRTMEQRTKTHGEEVHAIRQEVLHLRQQLESTFRKTLKDLGGTYRRKAFEALGIEAKTDMRANKLLREEMALQELGLSALGERHTEEIRMAGECKGELQQLRNAKDGHQTILASLQRERRANCSSFTDIQETKSRIAAAEQALKIELERQGVPSVGLNEIREMTSKERQEGRRLNRLKLRWQRRSEEVMRAICPSRSEPKLPTASVRSVPLSSGSPAESTAESFGSTSQTWSTSMESTSTSTSTALQDPFHVPFERHRKLLGSKSAPSGLEIFLIRDNDNISGPPHRQGAGAAWQARISRITKRWNKLDPCGLDRDSLNREGKPGSAAALALAEEVLPGRRRSAQIEGTLSTSLSAPKSGLSPLQSPSPSRLKIHGGGNSPNGSLEKPPHAGGGNTGKTPPPAALPGSMSMGQLRFRSIVEEDPWEKKRRMERTVRRRDAGLRAKGFAVNSARSPDRGGKKGWRANREDNSKLRVASGQ
ncbi:unnamed protein product [Ectocarpus sp. 13 AM-2016]